MAVIVTQREINMKTILNSRYNDRPEADALMTNEVKDAGDEKAPSDRFSYCRNKLQLQNLTKSH